MEANNEIEGLISIIIPIYNAENYLRKCFNSLINQTYSQIEVIMINDGSTDESLKICEEYVAKDKRFKLINIKNHGQGYARNIGITNAKGEYIGFIDADDFVELDMYEILYKIAKKNNADFVGCDHSNYSNGKIEYKRAFEKKGVLTHFNRDEAIEDFAKGKGIAWGVWDKIFKKSSIQNIRFPNKKIHAEDTIFILDFLKVNTNFYNIKLGKYIHNDDNVNSTTKQKWTQSNLGLNIFLSDLYEVCKTNNLNCAEEVEARYYENTLSSYLRCVRYNYVDDAKQLFSILKINKKNIIRSRKLSKLIKLDILICLYSPCRGKFANFWYK